MNVNFDMQDGMIIIDTRLRLMLKKQIKPQRVKITEYNDFVNTIQDTIPELEDIVPIVENQVKNTFDIAHTEKMPSDEDDKDNILEQLHIDTDKYKNKSSGNPINPMVNMMETLASMKQQYDNQQYDNQQYDNQQKQFDSDTSDDSLIDDDLNAIINQIKKVGKDNNKDNNIDSDKDNVVELSDDD